MGAGAPVWGYIVLFVILGLFAVRVISLCLDEELFMLIADGCVVSLHFKLTNDNDEILDQSAGGEPLVYLHGAAGIIPKLETALAGKAAGDNFKVTIQPEDAYGDYNPELAKTVPRSQFPANTEIAVGMRFNAQTPNGQTTLIVTETSDSTVTVDGNHPLAGTVLNFDGTIEDVRAASAEELDHGHVH